MLPTVINHFLTIGCTFPDVDLLQPADPFLDTTGEDLRRRIFMTQETSGKQLCLRPEFTIPVCLNHLKEGHEQARYAYGGKVFRQRSEGATEFTQAGFEDLGNPDKASSDIYCITTALELLKNAQISAPRLVVGNQAIFVSLLDALEIPNAWRKKLLRAFGDNARLQNQLKAMSVGVEPINTLSDDIASAIDLENREKVLNLVTEHMVKDGLPLSGGRTPTAITERLFELRELQNTILSSDKAKALQAFLSLEVDLNEASNAIEAFEADHGIELSGAASRLEHLASATLGDVASAQYRASFGRRLDYYTGLVFEVYGDDQTKPLIGGGRYDQLLTLLGSETEVPAVGFAVWVDRLGGVS
ncbi:MAG: ATP phosphoribosyltransferase regulatory subunit [Rhizobiaceae bacterium]|nr:ATP phosphoribosyltransferase regulatory subunit [Rhizobiaceae bacterium]